VRVDGGALDFGLNRLSDGEKSWVSEWLGGAHAEPANAWKLKL
jgi:hypothetical protein